METWFLTSREEINPRVFGNRMPKRILDFKWTEAVRDWQNA
jgi:hypothetical protein